MDMETSAKIERSLKEISRDIAETNLRLMKMEDDNKEYHEYVKKYYEESKEYNKKVDMMLSNIEIIRADIAKILDKVDTHDTDIDKLYKVM